MSYESETKNAYRNIEKANLYKNQYIKGFKWARFTMWKQKKIVNDFLHSINFNNKEKILDVPCGAGYVGDILSKLESQVVASDISFEMMNLALNEYPGNNFTGFIQSDITEMPFQNEEFRCSVILALMHRLPFEVRNDVLNEINRVTEKYIIVSYSVNNFLQRVKQIFLSLTNKSYLPAPAGISLNEITRDFSKHNLKILQKKNVFFILSAKVVFLLEKS